MMELNLIANVEQTVQEKTSQEITIIDKDHNLLMWSVSMGESAWQDLADKTQKQIDDRIPEAFSNLYLELWKKAKPTLPVGEMFDLSMLKNIDEIILKMSDKFIEIRSIRIIPKQKSLDEALKESRKEVKLVKKK